MTAEHANHQRKNGYCTNLILIGRDMFSQTIHRNLPSLASRRRNSITE